ncbi:MAG TPA: alpha/beta fold hydrolase [Candidatus Binatia bacterium]|nr:alpha/beta fold hydrolase [Candidatus Binatia bacterium]
MWKRITVFFTLAGLAGCGGVRNSELSQLESAAPAAATRFFYESQGGKAEAFIVRPEGKGPFPLIVLVHGHSRSGRGAEVLTPVEELFAKYLCYAAVAVSLPSYGATEIANGGDREVVTGVLSDGIANVSRLSWVDKQKIMLYGFSRGAVFAAAAIPRLPHLQAVVLHSGAYDLGELYRDTPAEWIRQVLNPNGEAAPKLFNVLPEVSRWAVPTLVLHGAKDSLLPVSQAEMLDQSLKAARLPHRTVIFPDAGHRLPLDGTAKAVFSFLQEYVGNGCQR